MNAQLRKHARNLFGKRLVRLMNNAVYKKTCKNLKKRTDIYLLTDGNEAKKLVENPQCLNLIIVNKDLVGLQLHKIRMMSDKPFYVGFTVLKLSKLKMAKFHYDIFKARYGDKATLYFTDNDSFMYEIEAADMYQDM